MQENEFDVVIVGGGLVGVSLGCALAPTSMRVGLVEAIPFRSQNEPSYDDRVLAIAQGSKRILDTIGAWTEIGESDRTPIKSIHISDRGGFGGTRLHHSSHGVEALGYAVPARALGAALIRRLRQQTQVKLWCPAEVRDIESTSRAVQLNMTGESDQQLTSRLVVFADGTGSALRDELGFRSVSREYGQSAVVTTITPEKNHHNIAYERFTDSGPLALLPTSGNRYTVVWTVRDEQVNEILNCADDEFLRELQHRFGDRIGRLSKPGRRKSYSLSRVYVKHPVKQRVAVVGNAAHTLHPVAGQGFNLGLRDVSTLAEVLNDAARDGEDIGNLDVLNRFWQWRQRDIRRVGSFTDALVRVFSNNLFPLKIMRDSALVALDIFPPAQRLLVKRTMGFAGRLPRLSRGLPLA